MFVHILYFEENPNNDSIAHTLVKEETESLSVQICCSESELWHVGEAQCDLVCVTCSFLLYNFRNIDLMILHACDLGLTSGLWKY